MGRRLFWVCNMQEGVGRDLTDAVRKTIWTQTSFLLGMGCSGCCWLQYPLRQVVKLRLGELFRSLLPYIFRGAETLFFLFSETNDWNGSKPPKQARSVYHLQMVIWGLKCFSDNCFFKVVFVSDRQDHRNREYQQAKAESTNNSIWVGTIMQSWKISWADGGRRGTWSCEKGFLVCFLLCSGKRTLPAFVNKTRSKRCLRKPFSAKFLNSDKIWNIWHSEIIVNPFLLPCLQYLWTGDPSAVSRQLGSGAVGGESLDEVPGTSSQGLWLLQHAAEETCPSAGDPAVWRAWGSVCCPEEHQLDCAEKVKPQGCYTCFVTGRLVISDLQIFPRAQNFI